MCSRKRGFDARRGKRRLAHASARSVEDSIGDGRSRGAAGRFARAARGKFGMVNEHDIDLCRNFWRARDRVSNPIDARDITAIEGDFFLHSAAHGLNQICGDGSAQGFGVDD